MIEKVELTRRRGYGRDPIQDLSLYGSRRDPYFYKGIEPYEYTLRYGDNYCRVLEDWHMIEMRMSMPEAEYNRYLIDRLTNEMLGHIRGVIKNGLNQQAANNAPPKDNMAYLFKN